METENTDLYKYSEKGIKKRNLNLWTIINSIDIEIPFKEKFYLYENSLNEKPVCECGSEVKFIDMIKGYREFCSKECMYNSDKIKEKKRKTNIEKWGVDNPSKSNVIKQKVKKTNNKKFGKDWATQNNNIKNKIKSTNIEKWGVDNPMKLDEIKEKKESTMLEKWGVRHAMQSDEIKKELKKYFINKLGVDNPMKLDEVKEKKESTMLEKWGVKHALQNKDLLDKLKMTNIENLGVEFPIQNLDIKNKIKETNIEKWGFDNPSKSEKVKEKIKSTILKKWGTLNLNSIEEINNKINKKNIDKFGKSHISKSENYRLENYKISKNINYINYMENGISLFHCDLGKDHKFQIHIDNYLKRTESNIPLCTQCYPIDDLRSIKEKEFIRFIENNYTGEVIKSYRDFLEIDIYLPNLKIGFEFDGLYWHSDKFKDKFYHINKTNYFLEKGIRIIHIWEDDWDFKKDIIKSQVLNLFNKSSKIWARKCHVKEIKDSKVVTKFLEENHIQGKVGSSLKLGLYYKEELVTLMTLDHYEGRNKMSKDDWNINRFCNKINHSVVGGASKLLKYFIKNYKVSKIISYADYDWSNGNLYKNLGFELKYKTEPDYKYIIEGKRVNKSRFRKSRLETDLSESNYMKMMNILKVWDCGKLKFEFINQ